MSRPVQLVRNMGDVGTAVSATTYFLGGDRHDSWFNMRVIVQVAKALSDFGNWLNDKGTRRFQ